MEIQTIQDDRWESGGHILADLCFRDGEHALLRAKLALQIRGILDERGLGRDEAARVLGATESEAAALMRCERINVSLGKLVEFLAILGREVDIAVTPASRRGSGRMSVVVTRIVA